jgi:hypothetical protein
VQRNRICLALEKERKKQKKERKITREGNNTNEGIRGNSRVQ